MRFTSCVLCKEEVITSNAKDGVCVLCWRKIKRGEEPTLTNYIKLDILVEFFPKSRGRCLE